MQVKSPLADMQIDIKKVSIQGRYIVVRSDSDTSLDTIVYMNPLDFWVFVRAVFTSALLFYVVTYPVQYMLYKMGVGTHTDEKTKGGNGGHKASDHPTSHPW